jgi:hypothetical protein
MRKIFIPQGHKEFRAYIVTSHDKLYGEPKYFGVPIAVLNAYGALYLDYLAKDDLAENPDTATKGNRDARNVARDLLEAAWRQIVNEWLRFSSSISVADKEVFHIYPRDLHPTPARTPKDKGLARIRRLGVCQYEITVVDEENLKRKLPADATGSYLYLCVTEAGVLPESFEAYRKLDFSSTAVHLLDFPSSQIRMEAHIYVRYANQHGKEGPRGEAETFVIN